MILAVGHMPKEDPQQQRSRTSPRYFTNPVDLGRRPVLPISCCLQELPSGCRLRVVLVGIWCFLYIGGPFRGCPYNTESLEQGSDFSAVFNRVDKDVCSFGMVTAAQVGAIHGHHSSLYFLFVVRGLGPVG